MWWCWMQEEEEDHLNWLEIEALYTEEEKLWQWKEREGTK